LFIKILIFKRKAGNSVLQIGFFLLF